MAAGDMAALVGEHADQLVGSLGGQQQAGVDEYSLAAGDEGVEAVVLDDHDLDRLRIEAGDTPDRRNKGADRVLDLGVADEFELTLLRNGGTNRQRGQQCQAEEGDNASFHG